MNLLENNRELNRLLDKWPIQIITLDTKIAYLIRPMPRSAIMENHVTYYHNGYAYAITLLGPAYKFPCKFIIK